jgi:dephospho-CoA kinase
MENTMVRTERAASTKPYQVNIGLTGSMASGKGELAKCLKRIKFTYISLSDIVRDAARHRGIKKLSRQDMQDIGNELRQLGGPGILAKKIREKINSTRSKKWIIDGIRNPAEVAELRKLPQFYLIGIKSDPDILIERMNSRNRSTDLAPPAELKEVILREWGNGEPEEGQQVGRCMELADFTIENNGTLKELQKKCQNILATIEEKNGR